MHRPSPSTTKVRRAVLATSAVAALVLATPSLASAASGRHDPLADERLLLRPDPQRQPGRAEMADLLVQQRAHPGLEHEHGPAQRQRREGVPPRAFEDDDVHGGG